MPSKTGASADATLQHLPQSLDHALVDHYALPTADLTLVEAALGWNPDLGNAGLPREAAYSREQFLELLGELLDRHEEFRIERDEEMSEVADVAAAQSSAGHEAERLNRD